MTIEALAMLFDASGNAPHGDGFLHAPEMLADLRQAVTLSEHMKLRRQAVPDIVYRYLWKMFTEGRWRHLFGDCLREVQPLLGGTTLPDEMVQGLITHGLTNDLKRFDAKLFSPQMQALIWLPAPAPTPTAPQTNLA